MNKQIKVYNYIRKNKLIQKGDKILIGLSGGADSVCLTHMLYSMKDKLGIELYTAHLNHGIRGEEALRDEEFVKKFSDKLQIKCFVRHADIKADSKQRGISEELCGREARYSFFEEIMERNGITKIATAHNKNDNAETILMNFIRGASISGLCGIPFRRDKIIRPILTLTRNEIIEYINENNLSYVTDSTNLEEIYTRNKVRLDLIPKLESEFNANFIETTVRNAENVRYDSELLEILADEAYNKCCGGDTLDIKLFLQEHISIRRRILYKMLTAHTGTENISSLYIDELEKLIGKTGKRINLPNNLEAVMEYDCLRLRKKQPQAEDFEYKLELGNEVIIEELGIIAKIVATDTKDKQAFTVPLNSEISIRNRRNGDYFYPEGMEGKKKLKDYFIDEKIERDRRGNIGLLTVNGEIMYVIGKRRDRRFAFKDNGIRLIIKNI